MPEHIVCADDVNQGKPSPQPYLMGAEKLGIPIDQCVVVEDAPSGVKSGKAAGMRVIGIASTHPPNTLLDAGVDFLVESLAKIQISGNGQNQSINIELTTQ